MTEQDDGGILDSLKDFLTSSPTSEFHRFDFYESEWRIDRWNEAAFGHYEIQCFNDEREYLVVVRTEGEFQPEEYVVELTPYEIMNIENNGDGTRTIDYEYGNEEVVRTRDDEKEAKDLALEIMKTIERGDWDRRGPGLGSLKSEYNPTGESQ